MAKSKSELADSLATELADSVNKKFKNTEICNNIKKSIMFTKIQF